MNRFEQPRLEPADITAPRAQTPGPDLELRHVTADTVTPNEDPRELKGGALARMTMRVQVETGDDEEMPAEPPSHTGDVQANEPEPTPADGTDTPPPIEPTETTNPGFPERHQALQRLMGYAAAYQVPLDQPKIDTSLSREEQEAQELEIERRNEAADRALQETYGADLEAAGVNISHYPGKISISVTDADSFVAALKETPTPADNETRDRFGADSKAFVHAVLVEVADDITFSTPDAAQAARTVASKAETISQELTRLGAPEAIAQSVQDLATAHEGGRIKEWCAAVGYDILGGHEGRIGLERITTGDEWQRTFEYLRYLQRVAPGETFTERVFNTIEADIQATLANPDYTPQPSGLSHWRKAPYPLDHALERIQQMRAPADGQSAASETRAPTPESFEPYRQFVAEVNSHLDTETYPDNIPELVAVGGLCYVFKTPSGDIVKIPRVPAEDDFELMYLPTIDDLRSLYLSPLERGKGVDGLEQLITATEEGYGAVVVKEAPGRTVADMLPEEIETIPREHFDKLMQIARTMAEKRLCPDAHNTNLMYDYESGYTVIDYTTAEQRYEAFGESPRTAEEIAGLFEIMCVSNKTYYRGGYPNTHRNFYAAYKDAFGDEAASRLLDHWREKNIQLPPDLA